MIVDNADEGTAIFAYRVGRLRLVTSKPDFRTCKSINIQLFELGAGQFQLIVFDFICYEIVSIKFYESLEKLLSHD